MHIDMADDERYNTIDIGIVTFQRDSGAPLTLRDVKYVPSLKNNLGFLLCWKTVAMM